MWGARVGSRRQARGLAALVAVVVTVSLLGIAQAGAQQNPPVNQPGVTDSEIRVGGVGTVTGDPTGNNPGGPAFEGTQAYFDYINGSKDKGVCGRKLVLSSKRDDTLGNNRQEVQGLLDDNVFAALPMTTSLFTGPICSSAMASPPSGGSSTANGDPRTSTRARPTCSVKTDRSSTSNLQVPTTTPTPGWRRSSTRSASA